MSKSFWLLSAGLAALATPAYAQDDPTTPTTDQRRPSRPPSKMPTRPRARTNIVVTAQGRRQILQDVPLAVTAVGGEQMQNSGATDIRQLNQLAPSLLVSSTGTEANGSARIRGIGTVGDNPGLESSVAVFIDGVYRSRSRHRPQRARRDRAGRGAARPAGHLVRPQRLGRPHPRHQPAPRLRIRRLRRADLRQLRPDPRRRRDHRPDLANRSPSGSTPSTPAATASTTSSTRRAAPRARSTTATASSSAAKLLFEPNDALSFRLIADYSNREESCCGAVYLDRATNPLIGNLNEPAVPLTTGAVAARQRQQHHQRAARPRPAAGRVQQSRTAATSISARAAPSRARPRTWASRSRSIGISAARP